MTRTAIRIRFHHSRLTWQLAALLLAALLCLPSIPLAQSPPATPASVTVTRSDGALTATWPAASGTTKYHVTYTTDGGKRWHAPVDDHTNVTTTSIEFSADNAKTYVVGVRAGNDNDQWSGWRNSPAAGPYTPPNNPNPPAAVASVTITRADGTVSADWLAPSGATKYHVTYTTDNGTSWSLAALSHTTTSLTISNADNAKTYVVGVRAGNAGGWSGWVNSPASGPYTPPPPAVPTGLTAAAGDQSVTLAWSDPADASITGYEYAVQQAGHDPGAWTGIPDSNAATTSYTATGLTNGTAYSLHLRALNAGGSGAAAQASATPKAPVIVVTATRGNDGDTAGVSWTAYAGDGFEYYRIIVCNSAQYNGHSCSGTVFRSDAIHDAGSTGPVTVTGLKAGTGYGIILQVWRNGSALKRHATLSAPSLNVDGVDGAADAVTLANHNGQWYYTIENDDPGPEGDGAYGAASANNGPTCTGPVNGAQTTVTGSVYGSNYTLNAYTDPNCGGASIASAEFRIQSTDPPANQAGLCTYFYDRSGEGDWSGEYSLQAESDGRIYREFTEHRFLRYVDPNDHSSPHVDAACANASTWQRAYWQPNTSTDPVSISMEDSRGLVLGMRPLHRRRPQPARPQRLPHSAGSARAQSPQRDPGQRQAQPLVARAADARLLHHRLPSAVQHQQRQNLGRLRRHDRGLRQRRRPADPHRQQSRQLVRLHRPHPRHQRGGQ